jgi:histidinol-phosphate/aromatic aminotransferase/cobyric acid decarboxylase-like protein
VIERARGIVIIDEAYAEFAANGFAAAAPRFDRVLVVRTLSKAFGLAGLRIGYGIGTAPLVAEVEKSRGPYKVNALAENAATAALTDDLGWVRRHVDAVVGIRTRVADALRDLGLAPIGSSANFVLVPVSDAARIGGAMRRDGVAVRPMPRLPVVGDALRISIGPWEMMQRALDSLRMALECG